MTSRRKMLLLFGGALPQYLLYDAFTDTRAAGSVNGTLATPPPNVRVVGLPATRNVTDSGNFVSVAGAGLLTVGAVSQGDPRLAYSRDFGRMAGLALTFHLKIAVQTTSGQYFGFSSLLALTAPAMANASIRTPYNGGLPYLAYYNGTTLQLIGRVAVSNYPQDLIVIQRSAGYFMLSRGGVYPAGLATLLHVTNVGNSASQFVGWYCFDNNGSFTVDLQQLTAPGWQSDFGIAAYTASPGAGAVAAMPCGDGLVEFTWTPSAAQTLELDVRRTDADNRWIIRCDQAGSTIKIIRRAATVETELVSAAQTWTPATPYRLLVVVDGRLIEAFVASVSKVVTEQASFNATVPGVQASLAGANLAVYPRTLSLATGAYQALPTPNPNRGWCLNAAAPLTTPTYDGTGQAVHPDVYDAGAGNTWGSPAHRYWMALTPYASSNTALENPSILCSDDGNTWTVPAGLTNPVIPKPTDYNSDPDITVDGLGTMWMVYREATTPNDLIKVTSSADGVTWTAPVLLYATPHSSGLSPAVIWDGAQYVMFSVNMVAGYTLERRTAPAMMGPWSAALTIPFVPPPTLRAATPNPIWHADVIKDGALLWMFMNCQIPELWLAVSADNGLTWIISERPLLFKTTSAWDNSIIYRASGVRTATGFDLFYSAANNGAPAVWHIGRTTVSL